MEEGRKGEEGERRVRKGRGEAPEQGFGVVD